MTNHCLNKHVFYLWNIIVFYEFKEKGMKLGSTTEHQQARSINNTMPALKIKTRWFKSAFLKWHLKFTQIEFYQTEMMFFFPKYNT